MRRAAALVIETSTPRASMALVGADGPIAARAFTSDRSHNAALFGPLGELLEMPESDELPLVIVGSGPGSYSGTRVGIAAAQGVAIARGCPAVAVPSVLGLAEEDCVVVGDARRGHFWWARVEGRRMMEEPALTDASGIAEVIEAAGLPVFSFEDPSRFAVADAVLERVTVAFPEAERLWDAWCTAEEETRAKWLGSPPQPMYLKPPHITEAKRPWLTR